MRHGRKSSQFEVLFVRAIGLAAVLLLGSAPRAWAGVIRVAAGATGAGNGASWNDAYTSLQTALAAAQPGDEIWVAAGVYKPTSGTDRSESFVMTAGVAIYGGFGGGEAAREERNWTDHPTVLSGDIGVQGEVSDNVKHVVSGSSNAVLDGFTITAGNADDTEGAGMVNDSVTTLTIAHCLFSGNAAGDGGGAMYNFKSSPLVAGCTFAGNSTATYGGGLFNVYASPALTDCVFTGNTALSGGGMYNAYGSPAATNCTFNNNTAGGDGGGIYSYGGSPAATDCTFSGNTAGDGGNGGAITSNISSPTAANCVFSGNSSGNSGAMASVGGSAMVRNCVFTGNTATIGYGGAMGNYSNTATIVNCTFNGNKAEGAYGWGGALYNTGGAQTIANCIFWGDNATEGPEIYSNGGPTFSHCVIEGSGGSGEFWNTVLGTDGGGNTIEDPLFADAANPAGSDGVWRTGDDGLALQPVSRCIDGALADAAPATDIAGHPRVGPPDIGAYESPEPLSAATGWTLYR
ncbi:MAG: right-handed parallel beta-helix repeat-containing protein [bacterium]|nr:right-handed parallel beta-helix repeat-containing protein [bacterium]